MILIIIFLHLPQMTMSQGWCCFPYPCTSSKTVAPSIMSTAVTMPTQMTVTAITSSVATIRPFYTEWTAWSCTEICGGCGVGRRTRVCLSASFTCIHAAEEFNNQSCNQQPCQFGKKTCCGNYSLGQINGQFACVR